MSELQGRHTEPLGKHPLSNCSIFKQKLRKERGRDNKWILSILLNANLIVNPLEGPVGILAKGHHFFGEAVTISEGGMLFRSPRELPVETPIEVYFYVGDKSLITLKAIVLYNLVEKHNGKNSILVGLKFREINLTTRTRVQNYIKGQ